MQARFTTRRGTTSLLGGIVAMVALFVVATLIVGSACPEVHELLCHQASSAHADEDHCAIVAFSDGEVLALALFLTVEPLTVRLKPVFAPAPILAASQFDYRLQPTCGPPVLS